MAKSVQLVDWENTDDGFIQYEQQYRTEPVPLYIDTFMDMCYPPINEDFPLYVVSFIRGAFFFSWKEIDDERRGFEELLKKDHMGVGLGLRCTLQGDVVDVRAGIRFTVGALGLTVRH
ncbi:hypothetical protein RvY_17421 [Ramazzottius varieornatus]|uniref:Uncharacterized protein n=1 Tax=Ramazzottius varieornatus TaxID=947166 RepID=A0A1D1W7X2_RAMVA|nr:hypothetical protein RvY_17421 [Ramazzottius varieornatus]